MEDLLAKKIELNNDEKIIKQGLANQLRGAEAVGGNLFLTDKRIVFEPHFLNVQTSREDIPIEAVLSYKPRNTFLIIPNGIDLTLNSGKTKRFAVWNRKEWLGELSKRFNGG